VKSHWLREEAATVAVMEPESFMIGRRLTRDDVLDAAERLANLDRFDFGQWAVDAPPGALRRRTERT